MWGEAEHLHPCGLVPHAHRRTNCCPDALANAVIRGKVKPAVRLLEFRRLSLMPEDKAVPKHNTSFPLPLCMIHTKAVTGPRAPGPTLGGASSVRVDVSQTLT